MEIQISIFIDSQLRATRTVLSPCVIGRSRQADLTIGHPVVSRRHCELIENNGKLLIRDVGSLNGTFVKEQSINGEVPLLPGDSFRIGEMLFVVTYKMPVQNYLNSLMPSSSSSLVGESSSALTPASSMDLIDLSSLPVVIPHSPKL